MLTMTLNHISIALMPQSGTLAIAFKNIGYFTAVVMVCFLIEGYNYTKSKYNYAKRLLIFGIIAQVPFSLAAFGTISALPLNMFFTLILCLGIIDVHSNEGFVLLKAIKITGFIFLSLFCDWPLIAPIFTLLLLWAKNSNVKQALAFAGGTLCFGAFVYSSQIALYEAQQSALLQNNALLNAFYAMIGPALAGVVIVLFYNNKRREKEQKFSKYFFYAYYPLHLFIIGVLRLTVFTQGAVL